MKLKYFQKAKNIARDAGFHDIRHIGKWKEFDVLEPIFTDNNTHYIGIPQFFLAKEGNIRWTKSHKEISAIMNTLW